MHFSQDDDEGSIDNSDRSSSNGGVLEALPRAASPNHVDIENGMTRDNHTFNNSSYHASSQKKSFAVNLPQTSSTSIQSLHKISEFLDQRSGLKKLIVTEV